MQILACPYPGAVIGLTLVGIGLDGILPSSLQDLDLQFLDVRDNPALHGAIPLGIASPSLWGLEISNTSLNCHNDSISGNALLRFATRLHTVPENGTAAVAWSAAEQACVDIIRVHLNEWTVLEPRGDKLCDRTFLPGSNALLPTDYVLGIGCECPGASTNLLLPGASPWVLRHFCREFLYMWMVETVTFVLMLFYVFAVLYQLAQKHKSVFVDRVKLLSPPGSLHVVANVRLAALCLPVVC